MKIRELLKDEKSWTSRTFARDEFGNIVDYNSQSACKWCLLGALKKCYSPDHLGIWRKLDAETGMAASYWNDAPERTHAEVLALVEKLDI